MKRPIFSLSILLGFLVLAMLLFSQRQAYALTPTISMTPSRTSTIGCGVVVVVTSTPSPTHTATPRVATATATTCGPIYITATPGTGLPDLSVVSITEFNYTAPTATANTQGCWPSGPYNRIGLRVTVQNTGTAAAGTFAVDLNGSVLMVSGLAAGQTTSVDYLGMTLTRTRVATVDATGLVAESNESNNTLTLNLSAATSTATGTMPPQICVTRTPTRTSTAPSDGPDLVISSITYVGSSPACMNQPKDNVVVSNIGNAAAGTFYVTVNSGQYQVTGLGAGQSITLVVPATTSITATADSTNLVAESNESNNTASANLPIPTQAPTCTPTFTATPTPSITRTPTVFCITATPERMLVAPVTSPTSATTQVISVTLNNGVSVTITSEAGSFTSTTKVGNVFSVTINLVPNSTNHLQVQGMVNASNLCAPYTLSTTVDSSGNPLTIVQSGSPVTPTRTRTSTRTPTPTPTRSVTPGLNLALNKPVTCSSVENAGTACPNAVDGSLSTRWSSAFADPQWISIDLGIIRPIARVVLRWEAAYGKSYQIQTSNDGVTWTAVYVTTTGNGGVDDLGGLNTSARYIRMVGTVRATQYGYSLWEFEVYSSN